MARSRSTPSISSRSHLTPASSSAHQKTSSVKTTPPSNVTNVFVQRHTPTTSPMMGGGSGMLGTMAAVAGGSVLGHGISNYLYGRSNDNGAMPAPTQPAEAQ
uniref:Putative beta-glucosidase I n=1 Tax=Lygus hesperus TaxID=30085 RepID=A0A0A9WSL8_LYGHE